MMLPIKKVMIVRQHGQDFLKKWITSILYGIQKNFLDVIRNLEKRLKKMSAFETPLENQKELLRGFVAAALCDFVDYLINLDDPIIVGGQYSKDKIVVAFASWTNTRNFNSMLDAAAVERWLKACDAGFLIGPKSLQVQSTTTIRDKVNELIEDGVIERPEIDDGEEWKRGN